MDYLFAFDNTLVVIICYLYNLYIYITLSDFCYVIAEPLKKDSGGQIHLRAFAWLCTAKGNHDYGIFFGLVY